MYLLSYNFYKGSGCVQVTSAVRAKLNVFSPYFFLVLLLIALLVVVLFYFLLYVLFFCSAHVFARSCLQP
jgi:hypothetical protein